MFSLNKIFLFPGKGCDLIGLENLIKYTVGICLLLILYMKDYIKVGKNDVED